MTKLRRLLSISILCSTLFASCAFAQSTLTQIQDTVYNPNGTPFNGTVVITWTGSSSPTGANPTPYSTSIKIYNGALSVLLTPSTSAVPAAYYLAVYNSNDGLISWTETWQVPSSATSVTLSQVRQTGSGTGTGTGTTGQGSVPISQVIGLTSYLNAITSSLTTLSSNLTSVNSTVNNLGNSVTTLTNLVNSLSTGGANAVFVDAESPAGIMNGTNPAFTLAQAPLSAGVLMLFRNGVIQASGIDYTLSGNTITFGAGGIPQSGDILQAFYRIAGTGPTATFADNELPAGTIDGSNLAFTLAVAPNPALGLKLYKNGTLLRQNTDYTLSGATITFVNAAVTPQPGDSIAAYYRH